MVQDFFHHQLMVGEGNFSCFFFPGGSHLNHGWQAVSVFSKCHLNHSLFKLIIPKWFQDLQKKHGFKLGLLLSSFPFLEPELMSILREENSPTQLNDEKKSLGLEDRLSRLAKKNCLNSFTLGFKMSKVV